MRCIHNDSLWLVPWSCDNVYRRFFHDCELLWFFEGRFFRILAFASETWTREVGQKWRSCQTSTNNNHIIEFRVCALSSSPTVCCGCCRCSGSKCQRVSEMHHHNWIIAFIWLMDDAVPSIHPSTATATTTKPALPATTSSEKRSPTWGVREICFVAVRKGKRVLLSSTRRKFFGWVMTEIILDQLLQFAQAQTAWDFRKTS